MERIEQAVKFMIDTANNEKHGYDQHFRWGERGDYDCSSLTIAAFKNAGFKLEGATYTGNMKNAFLKEGFYDISKDLNLAVATGLQRGDILLNELHHVAVYIGDNKIVQASINEKGGVIGGTPGDQTGNEINISPYKNYHRGGWNCVLRYKTIKQETKPITTNKQTNLISHDVEKGKFVVNGQNVEIDRIMLDDFQYIKLQDLVKLGLDGKWDNDTKITTINFK